MSRVPVGERAQAEGRCFTGVSATYGTLEEHVVLVAPDIAALRKMWGRLTDVPLDEGKVQSVGIFSSNDLRHWDDVLGTFF